MAHGLYEPQECESERTVIISELQGGENDPDQLLDTEVTATAFRAHPYRHPTIGWIDDLQSMTRDDLFGHYRQHYVPGNATLVVVGDVDTDDVLRRARDALRRRSPAARRRRSARAGGAAADRRAARAARARGDDGVPEVRLACAGGAPMTDFFPMLVLDAALTGAKGVNIWSSFRGAPPQRRARLYTALVERGLASVVARLAAADAGAVPLQRVASPRCDGVSLGVARGGAPRRRSSACGRDGLTEDEVARAKRQLRARLVFEDDSVTNIAHQIGYFETVTGPGYFDGARRRACSAVTPAQVADVAARRLARRAAHRRLVPSAGAQGVTTRRDERADRRSGTCCRTAPS